MLPWHLRSFLKAGWLLLFLGEHGWVCLQACGAMLLSRPRLGECAGVCDPKGEAPGLAQTPRLGSRHIAPGRDQLPLPPSPGQRVQRPGSRWAGGLSPFSVSLARAGTAASFILSQRPGPQGLLCQSFCGRGKPYFLFSRQAQRATQSLPACRGATALAPQVKGTGVTQHWEERAGGITHRRTERAPLQDAGCLLQHEVWRADLKKHLQLELANIGQGWGRLVPSGPQIGCECLPLFQLLRWPAPVPG